MNLYVFDSEHKNKIPVYVDAATQADLASTKSGWQTRWTSNFIREMKNKVALKRVDDDELLALMSYEISSESTAVEIIYIESAGHSNANYLKHKEPKKYLDIPKPLFAYAAMESRKAGYDGILVLKAKTTKHIDYYRSEYGAQQVSPHGDPFRMVIWDDITSALIDIFQDEEGDTHD